MWANTSAGGESREVGERLVAAAEERGHAVERLPTGSASAAIEAARQSLARGADRLVVVGGDGTVHHGIQVAARAGVAFGVVPAGSGDDFATAMALPADPAAAIERALGPTAPVDLIRMGDRYGATVATLGLSVEVTVRAGRLRWPRGSAKYTVATLLELPRMRTYPLRLTVDGERYDVSPNLLGIANTPMFGGGMRIAPDADPRDGALDIVLIGPARRRVMLQLLPRAGSGGHIGHRDVSVLRGSRIDIDADESFRVDVDGEPAGMTPITIEVAAGALLLAAGD